MRVSFLCGFKTTVHDKKKQAARRQPVWKRGSHQRYLPLVVSRVLGEVTGVDFGLWQRRLTTVVGDADGAG